MEEVHGHTRYVSTVIIVITTRKNEDTCRIEKQYSGMEDDWWKPLPLPLPERVREKHELEKAKIDTY